MKSTLLFLVLAVSAFAADLRLGIIGTDTSHAVAFTQVLNDASRPDHVPGARVVAAYKGGSPDIELSRSRVDKFAQEIQSKYGVEIVPDIPTLLKKVDAILLESVDGRPHLEQAKMVIAAGKPMFVDKPFAATLDDAREIARLAKEAGVPWFSSSSLRFGDIVKQLKTPDANAVTTWGPGPLEPKYALDLSWYAIHPIEMLYAMMGQGCEEVTRIHTNDSDLVVGRWKDGRIGSVHALRQARDYGAVVFAPKAVKQSDPSMKEGYVPLVKEIVKFFQTKQPPFPNEETLEIFAFMDAAQRSMQAGGQPTKLR